MPFSLIEATQGRKTMSWNCHISVIDLSHAVAMLNGVSPIHCSPEAMQSMQTQRFDYEPVPRILIVDDEDAIANLLKYTVEKAGWEATVSHTAGQAWEHMQSTAYSAVLLDWMLPDLSGYHLLSHMRDNRQTAHLPVIMLTARAMEEDRVAGLDNGADDYITKPFSPRELTARINALLRRKTPADVEPRLFVGALMLDPASMTVSADGETLEMGHAEFKLLKFLMANQGRVYSRGQLLDKVWGGHVSVEERTVDVQVLRLRKALKEHGYLVRTVRGVGYMLSQRQ